MKTIFENNGGSYTQQGDYLLPNLILPDVDKRAQILFEQTVKSLAEQEQVTEKLKAENMILWVRKMNNIRSRATEIVNEQVIYR